jgi:hypothetical protein
MSPGDWPPRPPPRHRMHPNLPLRLVPATARPMVQRRRVQRRRVQRRKPNLRRGTVPRPPPDLPWRDAVSPHPAAGLPKLSPQPLLPPRPPYPCQSPALSRLNVQQSLRPALRQPLRPKWTRTNAPLETIPTRTTTGDRPGTRTHRRWKRNLPWTGILPRAPATAPLRPPPPLVAPPPPAPASRAHHKTPGRAPELQLPRLPWPLAQAWMPPTHGPAL